MRPASEVHQLAQASPFFHQLRYDRLFEICSCCTLLACQPKAAGCKARQLMAQKQKARYHRSPEKFRRAARLTLMTPEKAAHVRAVKRAWYHRQDPEAMRLARLKCYDQRRAELRAYARARRAKRNGGLTKRSPLDVSQRILDHLQDRIAEGDTAPGIAAALGLPEKTVWGSVAKLMSKYVEQRPEKRRPLPGRRLVVVYGLRRTAVVTSTQGVTNA